MSLYLNEQKIIKLAFEEARKILITSMPISNGFIEREIKLSIDLELDKFFRTFLEKNTNDIVYSEESLGIIPQSGRCWIVDPLDGSLNYFRNIPFYSSSIALWINGAPVLGFVYDYVHNDYYFGEVGVGATLNSTTIKVSKIPEMNGIKMTGIPSHTNEVTSLDMFKSSLRTFKKLRWIGCASLSLCYVASAKAEAYEEQGIKIWDVAAGMAIVLAAGGKINHSFNEDGSLNLTANNGLVNDK